MSATSASLLHRAVPGRSTDRRLAIAAKGFRPFFLLAALFAVVIVPVWLLVIRGLVTPGPYVEGASWHAHEMVFGFVVAVIAGFLLTAVGNWTERETLVGAPLLALSALWVAGRAAMVFATSLPHGLAALVDLAFLPVLMAVLLRPLIAAKNRRNLVMVAILGALFAANLAVHLSALGVLSAGWARHACLFGIDVSVLMILVMAGRVFPMFTKNATRVATIRSIPWLDRAAIAGMAALSLTDVIFPDTRLASVTAGLVGVLAVARAVHWGARHTLRQPLLWILHAGYGWLALGLVLRAVSAYVGAVPSSLATHALTVGAIGSITLGMMARVSLGHTGRMLAAPRAMGVAFAAMVLAGIARVVVPVLAPQWYFASLLTAGFLWTVAFLVFLVVYAPILTAARVDGKPG